MLTPKQRDSSPVLQYSIRQYDYFVERSWTQHMKKPFRTGKKLEKAVIGK